MFGKSFFKILKRRGDGTIIIGGSPPNGRTNDSVFKMQSFDLVGLE